jgi:hypothetical protein
MAQLKSTNVTGNLAVTGKAVVGELIKQNAEEGEILMADGSKLFIYYNEGTGSLYISTTKPGG